MFKHILAPLDGSQLAEAALPATVYLAQTLGATVTLLHGIEYKAPPTVHGDNHLTTPEAARAYLSAVAARYFGNAPFVRQHVHASQSTDVAQTIVAHTEELQADLIVMCTHGQGYLRTRLFGSMVEKVIALGNTPVLLINPETVPTPFQCQQILAPLDGEPAHEQGLPVAVTLAQGCQASLHLVMVIPTPGTLPPHQAATGRLLPGVTAALLQLSQEGALTYLQTKQSALAAPGLTVTSTVQRGDPVEAIIAAAQSVHADLIVLGTHGKTHLDAFWSGSVTPRLAAQSPIPLLLAPVRAEGGDKGRLDD